MVGIALKIVLNIIKGFWLNNVEVCLYYGI
jgi:hypothetical protein